MTDLREELLSAWLNLSANLWNERIVREMSYNESFVCNLLARRLQDAPEDPWLTARDLCQRTKLLKSQMNKTLNDLENKGYIQRQRFEPDRRLIYVRLTPEGLEQYRREHQHILAVVTGLVDRLGPEKSAQLALLMDETARIMDKLEGTK